MRKPEDELLPAKIENGDEPKRSPTRAAHRSAVSLKHVAEHVGLSIAAVSRVLSDAPAAQSIPLKTRERIQAAARLLNYQPNVVARSLRSQRTHTVGVMVPEVSDGYATLVLAGVEEALLKHGYFYFLVSHHHRADLRKEYLNLLLGRAVEGMIVIDTELDEQPPVPTVAVSGKHLRDGVTSVVVNHESAAMMALSHLRELGHVDIAFIKGQSFSSDTQARWDGIRHAAHALKLRIHPELVAQLEGEQANHEPGHVATRKLLAAGKPFTALFCFNDIAAIGAVLALREAGLVIPRDVSVVGFDDVETAAFQNPGLTTVRQPLRQMGVLAAETVLEQIAARRGSSGEPLPHVRQLVVEPKLVLRASTTNRCEPGQASAGSDTEAAIRVNAG